MNPRPNFFQRNKFAIGAAISSMGKAFLDNYWLFTLPLEGDTNIDPGKNAAYLIGEAIVDAARWMIVGMILDRTPALHRNREPMAEAEMTHGYQSTGP